MIYTEGAPVDLLNAWLNDLQERAELEDALGQNVTPPSSSTVDTVIQTTTLIRKSHDLR